MCHNNITEKPLMCFDLDSTLIDAEVLDEIAKEFGVSKKVREVTNLAMAGKLDFTEALETRLELLKGFPLERIKHIANNLPLMPGSYELIHELKKRNFIVGIITGSFDVVAHIIAERLNVDFYVANKLEVKDKMLTGKVKLIVNDNKDIIMKNAAQQFGASITIAVGDGFNDISMLTAADMGVGFCAKPIVRKHAWLNVNEKDMAKINDLFRQRDYNIIVDRTVNEIAVKLFGLIGNVKYADISNLKDDALAYADVLIVRTQTKVNKEMIEKAKHLKIIATATTGVDHIDIEYAKSKGIAVVNAKGENADAVADYVFRMLLCATDDVFYTNNLLKRTAMFKEIKRNNTRFDLNGRTIGIVGLGNIGKKVALRAKSFGMKVKAYDPYVKEAKHSFEDVLGCDIVTLHPELNSETVHMIDESAFNMMKKDAILVNAARGAIVKETALINALKSNQIKFAILDVFENEPEYTMLYELKNTIVTPHIAGNSVNAKVNAAKRIFAEVMVLLSNTQYITIKNRN